MNAPSIRKIFKAMLAAGAATIVTLFVYAAIQQTYRTGGNDPQIELADDAAAALRAGAGMERVMPAHAVDLATGLGTFVIVYDSADHPLAGSGRLDGVLPAPPHGVLAIARSGGWHSITWMPRRDVRVAAVLRRVDDGSGRVVLAARSLREVEERTSRLLVMTALAWGALMLTSVVAALL